MVISHLVYDPSIGKQKPESIVNKTTACPFCDKAHLENIFDKDGPLIFLKNKYPTLKDTNQTVIIETESCEEDFTTYDKAHLYKLIRFAFKHWFLMMESNKYKSVLLFKNFGPYSGGSIHHAHMQIVGLETVDYTESISREQFMGKEIASKNSVTFNISKKPKIGFYEFNVALEDQEDIEIMADYIQVATHFILHHFHANCKSYNIFFYQYEGKIYAKILPRFATSPLFIGYAIAQVADNVEEMVGRVQELYF